MQNYVLSNAFELNCFGSSIKYKDNLFDFTKITIFGYFLPPGRSKNLGSILFPESQTTCPYASNKASYIKFKLCLGVLLTKKVKQKNYNVTTYNVFLTKKGQYG